ncbi:hypothetical protein JCM24511_02409 [Saitozyma sp. JCM 24511]|nr:hypothetical protein JCM24511_02409 [Saitozyma sp. JCM 24511]
MGRWSQTEFDRVLVSKIKQLYDECNETQPDDQVTDTRFRSFVKNLNPNDGATRACFQSLVQRTQRRGAANRLRRRIIRSSPGPSVFEFDRPDERPRARYYPRTSAVNEDEPIPLTAFEREPTPIPPRDAGVGTQPPLFRGSPDPLLLEGLFEDVTRAGSPLELPFTSLPLPLRGVSAPQSPSGARRHLRRRRSASPTSDARSPRQPSASPPRSPSRAWLEEYRSQQEQAGPPAFTSFLFNTLGDHGFTPSYAGRRRAEEDLGAVQRPVTRRRLNPPARADESTPEGWMLRDQRPTSLPSDLAPTMERDSRDTRDTRRDGIVFGEYPPRPSAARHDAGPGAPLGIEGGLFGLEAHLDGHANTEPVENMRTTLPRSPPVNAYTARTLPVSPPWADMDLPGDSDLAWSPDVTWFPA